MEGIERWRVRNQLRTNVWLLSGNQTAGMSGNRKKGTLVATILPYKNRLQTRAPVMLHVFVRRRSI
jgi:hypothetical protein